MANANIIEGIGMPRRRGAASHPRPSPRAVRSQLRAPDGGAGGTRMPVIGGRRDSTAGTSTLCRHYRGSSLQRARAS